MKMMVFYNLGAEHEHLNLTETAVGYYRKGKVIARTISNEFMDKRIGEILEKLCGEDQ
ncbi:MAG: hypothetical protein JST59_02480 [Actinobacteria bacterium]|nr:hypothetical protein [Actinomycetota bacterium]